MLCRLLQHWSNPCCSFTPSFQPAMLLDVPYCSNSRLLLSGQKVNQGLTHLFLVYSLMLFQPIFPTSRNCLSTPQISTTPCSQNNTFRTKKHLQIYIHILSYRNHHLLITSTSNTLPGKLLSTLLSLT